MLPDVLNCHFIRFTNTLILAKDCRIKRFIEDQLRLITDFAMRTYHMLYSGKCKQRPMVDGVARGEYNALDSGGVNIYEKVR